MRKFVLFVVLLSTPEIAFAGFLGNSSGDVAKILRSYAGRSIDTLIEPLGYPDRQEPVLDKMAYYWGEDHDDGPVCIVKIVAGADKVIVDYSAYGNIDGCDPVAKRLKASASDKLKK